MFYPWLHRPQCRRIAVGCVGGDPLRRHLGFRDRSLEERLRHLRSPLVADADEEGVHGESAIASSPTAARFNR